MTRLLKRVASRLPWSSQLLLRRMWYRVLIRSNRFDPGEPEFWKIGEWVRRGDWVLDVGANIGSYTREFSRAVGPDGRVVALEPVPVTFQLLCRHVNDLQDNVTLLNVAASDRSGIVEMNVPRLGSGLANLYQSSIAKNGSIKVLTIPLDALSVAEPIRLIKVDVEGHELNVLRGAIQLIKRDRPILILEGDRESFAELLTPMGYKRIHTSGSPNVVYVP